MKYLQWVASGPLSGLIASDFGVVLVEVPPSMICCLVEAVGEMYIV